MQAPGGSIDGSVVRLNIASIEPGESAELILDVEVLTSTAPGTLVKNVASIDALQSQPAVSNEVQFLVIDDAGELLDLQIAIAGSPSTIQPGEGIDYDVAFANQSGITASATRIPRVTRGDPPEFLCDTKQSGRYRPLRQSGPATAHHRNPIAL